MFQKFQHALGFAKAGIEKATRRTCTQCKVNGVSLVPE
jgi:hypothetical protein